MIILPNLITYAKNADLIVHEVFSVSPRFKNSPLSPIILGAHTTAEQAAAIFNETKPKLAVYSHIGDFPSDNSDIDYAARTRKSYTGRVIQGEDLMTITISDDISVSSELVE